MSIVNKDLFSYAIEDTITKRKKELDNKKDKDESDLFILETLNRAKVVFDAMKVCGLEVYGMNFEKFLKQVEDKQNIVFMSDEEYEDYRLFREYKLDKFKKAMRIIKIMEE